MIKKIEVFIDEINNISETIKKMSKDDNKKVRDIYSDVIIRFNNLEQSYFIDAMDYEDYRFYCNASKTLWELELNWLEKQSSLVMDNNYLQITVGLNRISTMLSSIRYN